MADWLSSKIGSTQTTPGANTTAKGGDWLSSVSGGDSTYRQNKLVSDIQPVTKVTQQPEEKKGLIAKAQGLLQTVGYKQQQGEWPKIFQNDESILKKSQADLVRRITLAKEKNQDSSLMEKNLANVSQALDPNASFFKKHSEALKQRVGRAAIQFQTGLAGMGSNVLDMVSQMTEASMDLKQNRYDSLKKSNPKLAEQYKEAWLPREGESTDNWFREKSNAIKKWTSEASVENPSFLEKVDQGAASMAGFTLLSLVTGGDATIPYITESAMEAANVYEDLRNEGKSIEDASINADGALVANLIVNKYLNIFEDLWDVKRTVSKISKGFGFEFVQEGIQQIISNLATGTDWIQGVLESALIGGTLGGTTTILIPGNQQVVIDSNENTVTTEKVPEDQILPQGEYNPDKVLEVVQDRNLENTPEGKELVKKVAEAKTNGEETVKVYRGSKGQVVEEVRSFGNVLVIEKNQLELIKQLAEEGNVKAKEHLDSIPEGVTKPDFTISDPIIREAFKDQYDAIQYNNEQMKQIGREWHDLKTNKFYAEERLIAEAYAKQNRGAKYEGEKEQVSPEVDLVKQAKTGLEKESQELNKYYSSQDQEKVNQAWYEVITEMDVAEAGQRLFNEDGEFSGAISSTFPDWIPSELRSRKLFDSVMDGLADPNNLKYPPNSQPRKQRLYDEILAEIDNRADTDSSDIIERIKNAGEEIKKAKQAKKATARSAKRSEAAKREKKINEYIESKKTIKFREDDIDTIEDVEESAVTSKFLEHPEVKSRKTASYSFLDNFSRSGKLGLKPKEQKIIKRVLDTHFPGQKKIDMKEFRRLVIGELMPLNTIKSSTYADYGSDNIGINADRNTTYIMDAPYKHGVTGHFSPDYELNIAQDSVEVREIPAQEGNPNAKWAVVRKGVELTRENIEENVLTVATSKDSAESWIRQHSSEYSGRLTVPQKSGLFSHFRAFDVDNIAHIAEVQSDTFQHLERIDETLEIKGRLKTQQEQLEQSEQYLAQQEQILERAKARMADGKEIQEYVDRYQDSVDRAKEDVDFTKNEIEVLKKRLENVDQVSKEQAQFLEYKNIWHERTIREAIRTKALEGFEKIRFPTPRTIAFIEGYTSEDGGMPYEVLEADDHERLEPGDTIDYGGEEMTVVDGDEYQITVAPSDKVNTFSYNDYVDEDLDARFEDVVYEFENLEKTFGIIPDSPETAQAVLDAEEVLNKYVEYRNIEKDVKTATDNMIGEGSDVAELKERVVRAKDSITEYEKTIELIKTGILEKQEFTLQGVEPEVFDERLLEFARDNNIKEWTVSRIGKAITILGTDHGLTESEYYKALKNKSIELIEEEIVPVSSQISWNEDKIASDEKYLANELKKIKARKKPTQAEMDKLKVFPKSSKEILDSLPDYLSGYSFAYEADILEAIVNGEITEAEDYRDTWKEKELEDGYDPDLEGIYKEVYMHDNGAYDQTVYAVDGYSETFQQPDEYEPAVSTEDFNIEDYDQDQQVVLRFYERQLNKYIKKLRKGNLELVEDDQGFEWYESELKPEDKNATIAFRLKDDLAEAGIMVTDAQEQEIIDLNKKIFGDDDIRFVSQVMANNKALGAYSQKMIEILGKQANPKDTFFHEAVHKYIDVFTTKEEQFSLFEEGMKRYKTDDLGLVEERIAEDFIKYANDAKSVKGIISRFFQKIISRIKAFNKNASKIEKLYEEILGGKAVKKKATKKTKASKVAVSIEQNLNQRFENLAGFETRTVKDQAKMVSSLIAKDPDLVRQIVTGDKPLPAGMSASMFIAGVERYATSTNDIDLIRSLATSPLTSETSVHAQELRFLAERDKTSVLGKVQEIADERAKIFKRTHKQSSEKLIKKEVKKLKETTKVSKYDWQSFIDSITC